MKIMISTSTDHLVLFEQLSNKEGCHEFHFTRFDFNGQILSRGSLKGTDTVSLSRPLESPRPSDVNGCATVWSYFLPDQLKGTGNPGAKLTHVQYDPQQDELQLKTNRMASYLWPERLFVWKDVAYYSSHSYYMSIVDLSSGNTLDAATMGNSPCPHRWTPHNQGNELDMCMFGDEDFLVIACERGFLTWCFNKDTKMHNENSDYAIHRQRAIEVSQKSQRDRERKAIAHVSGQEELNLEIIGSVGSRHEFHGRQTEIESGN